MQNSILRFLALLVTAVLAGNTQAAAVYGQGTWGTDLQARDLDGNGTTDAFYDASLNITWLADANPSYTIETQNGLAWADAVSWASHFSLGGYADWRLPLMFDSSPCVYANSGTACGINVLPTSSEMAHLFFVTFGNVSVVDANGNLVPYRVNNSGNFTNLVGRAYWMDKSYVGDPSEAWFFEFSDGQQSALTKNYPGMFIPVHDGDVGTPVPEPGTLTLLGVSLAGLGFSRRSSMRRTN